MHFLSLIILVFIAVLVTVNALIKPAFRIYWLLAGSLVFISLLSVPSVVLVVVLSLFNFYTVKKVATDRNIFFLNSMLNIAAIVFANYIISSGNTEGFGFRLIDYSVHPALLTLGLSFYTLQHIAYCIDCRRGNQKAETDFFKFLFVATFFPKFLSGPLVKYEELNKQHGKIILQADLVQGFNRLLMGVFKKMVIADRLAPAVHSVFDFGDEYPGLTVLAGALLFTIQLYFDFSGYTDMAIGTAKMVGYELPENFRMPFRSVSVTEFWRRWHLSLIRFFTEYIFYPVSYAWRKYKYLSAALGISLTFIVSGLWHGIGLSFFLWSLCHMLYLLLELATKKIRREGVIVFKVAGWLFTILAVAFSNVFFRSSDTAALLQNWKSISQHFFPENYTAQLLAPLAVGGHQADFFNLCVSLALAVLFLLFEKRWNSLAVKREFSVGYVSVVVLLICLFGVFASGEQFIYVQF